MPLGKDTRSMYMYLFNKLPTRACRHLADSQAWLELLPDAADSG